MENFDTERLLSIFLGKQPEARSPYKLYGCPPMWKILERDGLALFARPAKAMHKTAPHAPHAEIDGVAWQWQKNGEWEGQCSVGTFNHFLDNVVNVDARVDPVHDATWDEANIEGPKA